MKLEDKLREGFGFINGVLWIILIPILLNIAELMAYQDLFNTVYVPAKKMFMIKIGFIDSPPSIRFLLEDFPSVLFKYNNNGFTGIINKLSLFNVLLIITVSLITAFLHSGFLSVIGVESHKRPTLGDFFIKGNRLWFKFFILDLLSIIPMLLILIKKEFIYLAFINIIFIYVEYSFVADDVGIWDNFKLGIAFLFNNFGLTIKMALYFGIFFSLISVPVFIISNLGTTGVIIDIIIIGYFGSVVNRAVLEVYRGVENLQKS
jgi:hypothetical protein